MLSIRQLEIFTAVCEEGSMTAAAKKIYMSQPAISQTIKDIESTYNAKMFERYGTKLFLTPPGKTLYNYAKRILNLFSDLEDSLKTIEDSTEIRIGGNISAGTSQILPLIDEFKKIHPDITVKVMVYQAPVLMKALQQNDLDLALIEDRREIKEYGDFITEPYYKDRITVVASKDHPFAGKTVPLSSLSDETFLLREKSAGVRSLFDHILALNNMQVNIGWECTSTEAIVEAVQKNIGIAVLPYLLVKKYLDEGSIKEIPLSDVSLSRNLNITYHKDKVMTTALKDFIELVKKMN